VQFGQTLQPDGSIIKHYPNSDIDLQSLDIDIEPKQTLSINFDWSRMYSQTKISGSFERKEFFMDRLFDAGSRISCVKVNYKDNRNKNHDICEDMDYVIKAMQEPKKMKIILMDWVPASFLDNQYAK
jgi:hypothetical protein